MGTIKRLVAIELLELKAMETYSLKAVNFIASGMKIATMYNAVITNVCRFFHTMIVFKRVLSSCWSPLLASTVTGNS